MEAQGATPRQEPAARFTTAVLRRGTHSILFGLSPTLLRLSSKILWFSYGKSRG